MCTLEYNFCVFWIFIKALNNDIVDGARGRTRTDTRLPLPDFESDASTSFTTRAKLRLKF